MRAAYLCVEAAEKVHNQILGRDVEKNDLTERATINDFILGKG
jgi:predicted DNA repair protein MutK